MWISQRVLYAPLRNSTASRYLVENAYNQQFERVRNFWLFEQGKACCKGVAQECRLKYFMCEFFRIRFAQSPSRVSNSPLPVLDFRDRTGSRGERLIRARARRSPFRSEHSIETLDHRSRSSGRRLGLRLIVPMRMSFCFGRIRAENWFFWTSLLERFVKNLVAFSVRREVQPLRRRNV